MRLELSIPKPEEKRELSFNDLVSSQPNFYGTWQSIMALVQENMKIEIGSEGINGALVWTPTQDILANGSWVRLTIPRQVLITLSQQLGI